MYPLKLQDILDSILNCYNMKNLRALNYWIVQLIHRREIPYNWWPEIEYHLQFMFDELN